MAIDQQELTRIIDKLVPDRTSARRAYEQDIPFDAALWSDLGKLGLTAAALPEDLGGSGAGLTEEATIAEALATMAAPVPTLTAFLAAHVLAAGEGAATHELATGLATGRMVVGAGLSAASGALVELELAQEDDQSGVISGIVEDLVDGAALDVVLFAVDGEWWAVRLDDPAVQRTRLITLDATRSLAKVVLTAAPARRVSDFPVADISPLAWTLLAAESAGAMAAALKMSQDYASQRRQFGELIGRFQAIKIKLANSLVAVEAARSAVAGAIASQKNGVPNLRMAMVAKVQGCGPAPEVIGECIQLHGAIGNTWDHDLHLLIRRAKFCQLALGSSDRLLDELANDLVTNPPRTARSNHRIEDDFNLEQSDRLFLEELRTFLDEHATPERIKEVRRGDVATRKAWQAEFAKGRWVGVDWPVEHNGRGASFIQQVLYYSELAARGAPIFIGKRGLALIGSTIIRHGTPEQKARFLEPTRRGDILWANGLSEPGAGSDLASLQTRGRVEGDELVISGSKIWTTNIAWTDWMYALIRTGPTHPKHAGISVVMIPLDLPGITIRPIRRMNGAYEFGQEFFDDVRVPLSNVIGEINQGWRVARTTLSHEHLTNFLGAQMRQSYLLEYMIAQLAKREAQDGEIDQTLRRRMATTWANAQILRIHGMRNVTRVHQGHDPGAEGSILKLFGQEEERRIYELGLDMHGPTGLIQERAGKDYLGARAATVGGGTSEIHRNKIAERVLGMPRDPWADDEATSLAEA